MRRTPRTASSARSFNEPAVTSLHEDRGRACSFGADPERYDRSRPTYPAELVDFLLADQPRNVLDVGCGTGIASRLFAARGCEVLGVEPDARMAEVARRHGIEVEAGRIEDWDPHGRSFDLLISGQAWHWVDPVAGAAKAAQVIRPSGRIGLFWNAGRPEPAATQRLDEVYARLAPGLDSYSIALGNVDPSRFHVAIDGLRATDAFGPAERRSFEWRRESLVADWLDQLPTHSDHSRLPPERLHPLLEAIGAALGGPDARLVVDYTTWLVTARR
jgi:SAM-dependent methyltransferase